MADFIITQKPQQATKVRESGIELLRCLVIFFVVCIHEIGFFFDGPSLFVYIVQVIAWPAIFCFSFITGYFLIQQKESENKIKPFLRLTFEIVIWRIVISFIVLTSLTLARQDPASEFFRGIGTIFLSLVDVKFWYFWAIIFVYFLFPFINAYLRSNYQRGKKLIIWLTIFLAFMSFLATFGSFFSAEFGTNFALYTDHYTLVIVLLSALFGACWRLVEQDRKIQGGWKLQLIGLAGLIVIYAANFSLGWWLDKTGPALSYLNILWYFSGFFYFLIFKNFKFKSRFVNWWANLSWWIYILHNGDFLPRRGAGQIIGLANLDPYTSTVLTILLCYFLTIALVLIAQNIDRWVIKPYIIAPCKKRHQERKIAKQETLVKK